MAVADPDQQAKLEALDARIKALKGEPDETKTLERDDHYSQVQQGWRMVIELVAGIAIGVGMGYGLDSLFGTLPMFLVLFTLLGLAAGIRVMLQTARELQPDYKPPSSDAPEADDDSPERGGK